MRIRPRFRAAGTIAATVLAMLAALMITPSAAAVAAPGQSGIAAPKPPPGFEDAAVLKVERKDRGAAQGYYIYCYVYVSNAYRAGSGVASTTNVTCVDEYNAYVAVDGIYIDTTIYRGGVPWQSNAGSASYFPYLNVSVSTSDCVTEYYYTRSYVQVVFPPNTTPPFLDGVFYSPNNVLVVC
jgi:hypothetical protein